MSKKSRQKYSKIIRRRKQKIERRLKRKQWEDQESPMFKDRKHPLRGSREESGDQLWGYRSNPSDGAEVWTGGGNKYEVIGNEGIGECRVFILAVYNETEYDLYQ